MMIFYRGDQAVVFVFVVGMAAAEVQKNLSPECKQFVYTDTLPRGLEDQPLKMICQFYEARFVTLYNTLSHIPVYSAYTFKRSDGSKRADAPWMYEPQLDIDRSFEDAQAVLDDYSDSVIFERGQLNPDEHQAHPDDKAATYTWTNVVPQVREFNIGAWKNHERTIRRRLNNYCRGTAYVVAGVTTSGQMIRRQNINRRVIPTYFWFVDFDHNAPFSERSKFPVSAAHGLKDRESNVVQEMMIQQLEDFLKRVTYVGNSFQIFYEHCVPPNSDLHLT